MLTIDKICVGYGSKNKKKTVVKDFSLTINRGEVVVILGPSGCGKSTLLNALAGDCPIMCGRVSMVNGGRSEKLDQKVHKVGIIPQNCGLLPWKRVEENCLLPKIIRKEKISQAEKGEINNIYKELGMEGILSAYPGQLSGGQVQRAAVARAFIYQPDILLMDEPFSSLDAIKREEAQELFLKVWEKKRITTLLVTHSIEEALYLGQRILVLGEKNAEIKYQMDNPYFGQLFLQDDQYLKTRNQLRSMLMTKE